MLGISPANIYHQRELTNEFLLGAATGASFLTIRAERKLFFFAMCIGAATFNLLDSLLGGLLMFFLLYLVARWATKTDPQILRLLLTTPKLKTHYDAVKITSITETRTFNV